MKCREIIDLLTSCGHEYMDHPLNDHIDYIDVQYGAYPGLYLMNDAAGSWCLSWVTLEDCEDYKEFIKTIEQPYPVEYTFKGRDGVRYMCRLVQEVRSADSLLSLRVYGADGYLVDEVYSDPTVTVPIYQQAKRATAAIGGSVLPTLTLRSRDYAGVRFASGPLYVIHRVVEGPDAKPQPCGLGNYYDLITYYGCDEYEAVYQQLKYWTKEQEVEYEASKNI